MTPALRKATEKDLPAIHGLVKQLADFEKMPNAVTTTLEDYSKALISKEIQIDVATVNDHIVGMTLYYSTFSTWKGKMMYLEDFYVEPSHRGYGIGSALFDLFLETAKSQECVLAKWQVLDWNTRAVDFYINKGATIEKDWWNGKISLTSLALS